MCKKLLVAAVAIVVGLSVVKHTQLGSLLQVWWHDAKATVERQVSPEVKIKQLVVEINKIDKDIKHNLSKLASREVECQGLEESVADLRSKQAQMRDDIARMEKLLDSGTHRVSFQGIAYETPEFTRKLDLAVNIYNHRKDDLKNKEQVLEQKRRTLEEAHRRISTMRDKKEELRLIVARLETQLEAVKLRQMESRIVDLDDSQVTRCEQLAAEIKEQLKKAEVEATLQAKYGYLTPSPALDGDQKSKAEVLKAARQALKEDGEAVAGGKK
jgi:chromosome segregation ATPase